MKNKPILIAFVCLICCGCTIKDSDFQIKGIQTNPNLILPVATGNLSIIDALQKKDSSSIKVTSDGLVYLSYDQQLTSQDIRDRIKIPDIASVQSSMDIASGTTYPANANDFTVPPSNPKTVDMKISPEQLREIAFKTGAMAYAISLAGATQFQYSVIVAIPEFISNTTGQGFSQELSGTGTVQLNDYTFKSSTPNKFTLQTSLVIKAHASDITFSSDATVTIGLSFSGMDFNYVKGFFGDQVVTPDVQTIALQAFGTSLQKGATVSFEQPTISFNVVSDYGVPLQVSFLKLNASKKSGASIALQTNPANPIQITSPTSLGTSATTPVSVTNVNAVVNFAPDQFQYQVSGHINPGISTGENFMADTSKMRVKMHVGIPLYGNASNIIIADTISLDLGSLDQSKIDSATLKSEVTNELPLDATMQFVFTDSKYKVIDSLLTTSQTGIIKGSTVDTNGDLASAGVLNQSIQLQSNKIIKLFQAKKIILRAKLNTSRDASGKAIDVKFKSQYKIKIQLALLVKLKVNANL